MVATLILEVDSSAVGCLRPSIAAVCADTGSESERRHRNTWRGELDEACVLCPAPCVSRGEIVSPAVDRRGICAGIYSTPKR